MSLLFTQVKSQVTTRQAAERYGVPVNRSGMAYCPFHDDRHPSMKIDERFYCFGCHITGDVIDFTARLFSLSLYDAAKKLANDFNIQPLPPRQSAPVSPLRKKHPRRRVCSVSASKESEVKFACVLFHGTLTACVLC